MTPSHRRIPTSRCRVTDDSIGRTTHRCGATAAHASSSVLLGTLRAPRASQTGGTPKTSAETANSRHARPNGRPGSGRRGRGRRRSDVATERRSRHRACGVHCNRAGCRGADLGTHSATGPTLDGPGAGHGDRHAGGDHRNVVLSVESRPNPLGADGRRRGQQRLLVLPAPRQHHECRPPLALASRRPAALDVEKLCAQPSVAGVERARRSRLGGGRS